MTTTSAAAPTFCTPSAGFVETMNGATASVVKLHGFGTGPATSGFPEVSLPAVTCTVYVVTSAKATAWLRTNTSFPGCQVYVVATPPLTVHITVGVSIASLNVTMMLLVSGTPVVPSAGSVDAMYGFPQIVVKDHGFGTGPATSGRPTLSLPAVICAVYTVHWANATPWLRVRTDSVPSHAPARLMPPVIVHVTVGVSIGSLNVTTRFASCATLTAASAGVVG